MKQNTQVNLLYALVLLFLLCGLARADGTDLVWSTFVGGEDDSDFGYACGVDDSGHVYISGYTYSVDFPFTHGAFDTICISSDAFVVKLNASGTDIVYATFLGGSSGDIGRAIAVDDSGSAYIAGRTSSVDFPTTPGAFDTITGGFDAFVTKFDMTGSVLEYSTFLGGNENDEIQSITLDDSNQIYVTGWTKSDDFPVTAGAFDPTYNGAEDVFVAKLNSTASALFYGTYLGGGVNEEGNAIAIDGSGNAYVTGYTTSSDFPTTIEAYDRSYNHNSDVFVIKLDATGSEPVYSTYIGGNGGDIGSGIAVSGDGRAYLVGATVSLDFPVTSWAFDSTFHGGGWYGSDAFVASLDAAGESLCYATFLGGDGDDWGYSLVLNDLGEVCLTGYTESADFPVTPGAYDTTHGGYWPDAFVTKMNGTGSSLLYSTFLGGSYDEDWGHSIAMDDSAYIYLTGYTLSQDFPATPNAFDPTYNGGYGDAFVTKLDLEVCPVPVILTSFQASSGYGFITLDWVTASEVNCHRWEVYRGQQKDGEYKKIGNLSGHGSTETEHTYRWVDRQISTGKTYFYRLKQVDFDGSTLLSDIVSVTAGSTVPGNYALHQNSPNPFNASTSISYQIPRATGVSLKVFNVFGQEVQTLVNERQWAGSYSVSWDGSNEDGQAMASGIYFCRLQAGEFAETVKMVLLR